jgi:HlyD family secretion protein
MKKTVILTASIVVVTLVALMVFVRLTSGKELQEMNFGAAKQGNFEISVSSIGELLAENSVDIKGPDIVRNRNFRSAGIKIVDLVPEGTEVKKGDYIATLDRSAFSNTLKDELENFKTIQTDLEMKILDTAVTLSTLRDDIKNQFFAVEEASIVLEQSKYEPPAVQRKAELALDKAQRLLNQDKKIYSLRYAQTKSEIRILKSSLAIQQSKVNDLQEILTGFTITAPSDGMVIYKKDRLGVKIKTGSTLNPWDPAVATLPDLSAMLSRVYVSEIDVSKVITGLPVQIKIDAFKGKSFTGHVASIANIGEQLSNSDSKVFEVLIKIDGSDPFLRPSMTTANKVITQTFDDVIYVPIESVHAGADSIPYVYTEEGTKQVVILGESNDKNIIIEQGLKAGESVWLITPDNPDKFTLAGNDLIPIIKDREKAIKLENERVVKENKLLTESKSASKSFTLSSGQGGSAGTGSAGGK